MRSQWLVVVVFTSTLISPESSEAANATLRVSDVIAAPGELLDVRVTLVGADEIGALDVQVSYDYQSLTFVEAAVGTIAANGMLRANEIAPGRLRIALIDGDGFSGDGELLTIQLRAAEEGLKSAPLVIDSVSAHHAVKLTAIPIKAEGGTITFRNQGGEVTQKDSGAVSSQATITWIWAPVVAVVFVIGILLGRRKSPSR